MNINTYKERIKSWFKINVDHTKMMHIIKIVTFRNLEQKQIFWLYSPTKIF